MSLRAVLICVILATNYVLAGDIQLNAKERELLELISSNEIPAIVFFEKFEKGYFDALAKRNVATYVVENLGNLKRINILRSASLLRTPESDRYLRILFWTNLTDEDTLVRIACVNGIDEIKPKEGLLAALLLLNDKFENVASNAAEIAVKRCEDEVTWMLLQRQYEKTKGDRKHYMTNSQFEVGHIQESWLEHSKRLLGEKERTQKN